MTVVEEERFDGTLAFTLQHHQGIQRDVRGPSTNISLLAFSTRCVTALATSIIASAISFYFRNCCKKMGVAFD